MSSINKLKKLMVSACEAVKEGHGDIARNLLEVAAEVMDDINPEDIETQFMTDAVDLTETAEETESDDNALTPEVASKSFHDMLAGWNIHGGTN